MKIETMKLTKSMRWEIADLLASDRLEKINSSCQMVRLKEGIYTKYVKRIIDITVSLIVLILTLPLNILIGVITYFDVGNPIFFKQKRVGKDGKIFHIIKFRNMKNTTDENGELLPPQMRVTKFGKFVRKTSLDELLNFWSILRGDMTLIGPRPLVPEYTHRYNDRHKMRLAVKPGLECPPRNNIEKVWSWHEQFENDVWYVENRSFLVDCKLIIRLFQFALSPKNSSARSMAERGTFMGYDEAGVAISSENVPQKYIDIVVKSDSKVVLDIDKKINESKPEVHTSQQIAI